MEIEIKEAELKNLILNSGSQYKDFLVKDKAIWNNPPYMLDLGSTSGRNLNLFMHRLQSTQEANVYYLGFAELLQKFLLQKNNLDNENGMMPCGGGEEEYTFFFRTEGTTPLEFLGFIRTIKYKVPLKTLFQPHIFGLDYKDRTAENANTFDIQYMAEIDRNHSRFFAQKNENLFHFSQLESLNVKEDRVAQILAEYTTLTDEQAYGLLMSAWGLSGISVVERRKLKKLVDTSPKYANNKIESDYEKINFDCLTYFPGITFK